MLFRLIVSVLFAACLMSCNRATLYSAGSTDFGSVVEFNQWPALPKGVAGYNLYMAEDPKGKFKQINGSPITGGRMVIPKLDEGVNYYFQITAVTFAGVEGKPSRVIVRKAAKMKSSQPRSSR